MAEAYPDVHLTRSLFEIDRDRITCSGGVATLDMMVALIARDHGFELATAVSEWFLQTNRREGADPQRMDLRYRLGISDARLIRVLKAMEANLEAPLSRERLANIAGLSLRHLERSFRASLGRGIHDHYLSMRIGRSRQLLRETRMPVTRVALASGFSSLSQFGRAFQRSQGVSPRRFRNPG
jgi:transcriptional regulator GlxA family with amidase domain